ncbi:hypothetical protein LshimejAT787_0800560 [Lyophyllum shimeji]|uniref:XLF-like N-terminal domain-containing protein n=1 Tax=Lyophyllum shimeji TaxID=47721 RepID=A0A9P3PPD3_LYOSH|nr:hypothetical protein LshimejAT787_0800560 [Lyophyllum shimeji]
MEHFSEEHSKYLLSKEWLVKTDNRTSTPYQFKFYSNTVDLSCCVLLTDTKSVWTEVLTSQQFARRWRDCNRPSAPFDSEAEEDEWRTVTLELLSRAHTLGAIPDISFEIVETNYSDLAFTLEYETFKWRWETCFVGHKASAEIISKHLIFPLISLNHLAFSSPEPVAELSDADVEKAVDKVGRTARRSVDTHIKNAMSKPRVASTLRRMTAMFNFIPDLPPVISTAEKPDLRISPAKARSKSPGTLRTVSVSPSVQDWAKDRALDVKSAGVPPVDSLKAPTLADSATESEDDDSGFAVKFQAVSGPSHSQFKATPVGSLEPQSRVSPAPRVSPVPSASKGPESDVDSSPARPVKKVKKAAPVSSSEEESEEERKRLVAQLKSGGGPGVAKRGPRQPIKRGGKRF